MNGGSVVYVYGNVGNRVGSSVGNVGAALLVGVSVASTASVGSGVGSRVGARVTVGSRVVGATEGCGVEGRAPILQLNIHITASCQELLRDGGMPFKGCGMEWRAPIHILKM